MEGLEGLPASAQQVATIVFAVVVAIGSGILVVINRRNGAPQPKVQEFYATSGFADMGPVKELIEQCGLQVQQQIRTNIALEATAAAIHRIALAYERHLEEEATQEEIEEKAQQLFERRMAQQRGAEQAPHDGPRPPRRKAAPEG